MIKEMMEEKHLMLATFTLAAALAIAFILLMILFIYHLRLIQIN